LNIALLQNNTLGPQTGGNMGNEYVHMHRLVDLITGQWGEDISPTTTGTFVDETYTYTIPAMYNNVPVELADLEIVAFVAETNSEIPSGAGAYPTYTGFAHANDANARYVVAIEDQCGIDISPKVNIQNNGEDPLTAVTINYSVNGGPTSSFNWTGNLTSLQDETVELPPIAYTMQGVNSVEVTLENDDNNANNTTSTDFNTAIEGTGTVHMILNSGTGGNQVTWELIDSSGTTVSSGGPYGNNQTFMDTFYLDADCYRMTVDDAGGDGGASVVMYDANNDIVFNVGGNYGEEAQGNFSSNGILGISDNVLEGVRIYPNPAQSQFNISNAETATVQVYNLLGQLVDTRSNISNNEQFDISRLQAGTYLVKIAIDKAVRVERLVISN
jgi:hypothetical protein